MNDTRAIWIVLYNLQRIIILCTAALIVGLTNPTGDFTGVIVGIILITAWWFSDAT